MGKKRFMAAIKVSFVLILLIWIIAPFSMALGEDSGFFGYPYASSEAIGSGHHEEAVGSRFTLAEEAGVTSISCLMQKDIDPDNPNTTYSLSFAIYADDSGAIGNLVAQTVQGTISNTVPEWKTLGFSSPIDLAPGAYWLLAVHNAINFVMINDVYNPASSNETVTSDIGSLTFPTLLNSPIYTPGMVCCIYASISSPVPEVSNTPSPNTTSSLPSTVVQISVSLPPTSSMPPSSPTSSASVTPSPSLHQSNAPNATPSPSPAGTISEAQSTNSMTPSPSPSSEAIFPFWLWILLALMTIVYVSFSLIIFVHNRRNAKKKHLSRLYGGSITR